MKSGYLLLAVVVLFSAPDKICSQGVPPRIAYVNANTAFHIPELKSAAANIGDSLRLSFFGDHSTEIPPVDELDPENFDIIIVEKSDAWLNEW